MALINCRECENKLAENAKTCPKSGWLTDNNKSRGLFINLAVELPVFLTLVWSLFLIIYSIGSSHNPTAEIIIALLCVNVLTGLSRT